MIKYRLLVFFSYKLMAYAYHLREKKIVADLDIKSVIKTNAVNFYLLSPNLSVLGFCSVAKRL